MVEILDEEKGAILRIVEDGETTYVYFAHLINKIWEDYERGIIDNAYTRGLLRDLQFTETQIFGMMEQLQLGRSEYNAYDYLEVSYT